MAAIRGKHLLKLGWKQGPIIGLAKEVAKTFPEDISREELLDVLEQVRKNPEEFDVEENPLQKLAQAFLAIPEQKKSQILDSPLDAPIWGEELIEKATITQFINSMRLPVTVGGALMPDAHVGYGIPIGGVVALENAVAPYMVGVDIACRMMMSILPLEPNEAFGRKRELVKIAMCQETSFGVGAEFERSVRRQHEVLDSPDWQTSKTLRALKDKAWAQLGTSGSGNHFIDAGSLEVDSKGTNTLGIPIGSYLAIMTHSGSRGVGASIAKQYSKLAQKLSTLPKQFKQLAWLNLDTEPGQEYWLAMNLAGNFASANHHVIHQAIAKRLGTKPLLQIENHHNFAWLENWQGKEVVVHRKGATPAHKDELGLIPGSQGHNSFVVKGKGNEKSLNSASHGAGRVMSRKVAKNNITKQDRATWLKKYDIELMAGGIDEAPQAYKNIEDVLALQNDLVETIATFKPHIVLMSADGKAED